MEFYFVKIRHTKNAGAGREKTASASNHKINNSLTRYHSRMFMQIGNYRAWQQTHSPVMPSDEGFIFFGFIAKYAIHLMVRRDEPLET